MRASWRPPTLMDRPTTAWPSTNQLDHATVAFANGTSATTART